MDIDPEFRGRKALQKYQGLRKHESSLIIQIRTGKIGLRAFLYQRGVPDIDTLLYCCSEGPETPAYVVLYCPLLIRQRERLRAALVPNPLRSTIDLVAATAAPKTAFLIVK